MTTIGNEAYRHQLAERFQKGESPAMRKILECALTEEEARFLLDLPAPTSELAARYNTDEPAIEEKLLGLARRGLLILSPQGRRFPQDLVMLHDGIMSSASGYIPAGMDKLWMEFYEGEGWAIDIGNALSSFPLPLVRSIPTPTSVAANTVLLPHENLAEIFRAKSDMITVRPCCCRAAAKKCDHPTQTCIQFGERGEFELQRGSGTKISVDEAISIAVAAVETGLVPMVSNGANVNELDFMCFCCGCCCVCLNPGQRIGALHKVMAPSRFVSTVVDDKCIACEACVQRCTISAIAVHDGVAVVDRNKCLGCGACVSSCPVDQGMAMELVRPPEFIPEKVFMPSMYAVGTAVSSAGTN